MIFFVIINNEISIFKNLSLLTLGIFYSEMNHQKLMNFQYIIENTFSYSVIQYFTIPIFHKLFIEFQNISCEIILKIFFFSKIWDFNISITSYLRSLCLINLPTSMIIVPTWWIMPDRREGIIHHEGTIIIDEGRLSRHKERKIWCYHYYYHFQLKEIRFFMTNFLLKTKVEIARSKISDIFMY